VALRPGELVMLDSTPLDVLAVLDDGVTGRVELSIALDVATRSLCAALLRPMGTTSVDAAMLLAQMVVPTAMRPGWDKALSMQRSVIPYERLIALDARLEQAAARPVIMPETVIVDQGRVYVSASFISACESLGVSVQPVPPANGPAKGNVERTFRAIADGFSQYLPGHTGSDVSQRGAAAEPDACWSLAQLQELLDEWVICGWQERRHEALRHPMMPQVAISPNEMWAALVAVTGHVPVPLSADDYVELLPLRWLAINDYGVRFKIVRNQPLRYGSSADKQVWNALVNGMDSALRLRQHRPGTLVTHAAYLHARTGGRMGSLSHLIREAALVSLLDGTEKITKKLLEQIELDTAAEQRARAPRRHRMPTQRQP